MSEQGQTPEPAASRGGSRRALFVLVGIGLLAGGLMAFLTILNPSRRASSRSFSGPTPVPDRVAEGQPAPDFSGVTPDGTTYRLSDLQGQPVAVNFWATWCAPCKVEMPELEAAYNAHAEDGFVILAVNAGDSVEATEAFMEENGLTFPAILDEEGDIVDLYEIRVFPTTIWIDGDGIVRAEHFGPLTEELINTYIEDISTPYEVGQAAGQ